MDSGELFGRAVVSVIVGTGGQAQGAVLDHAREVVAEVSLRSLAGIPGLAQQLGVRLLVDFPAFGQDADLEEEMHGAIGANLRHVFGRVMPTGAIEHLIAPPDALRFATSVLHRGIDTGDLIQAYRVGQNLAWSWWMGRLAAQIASREVLIQALDVSSQRMFAYVDAAIDQQVRLWEEERRRWLGRAISLRADAVRRVLRGEPLTPEEITQALDYQIDRPLLAAILQNDGHGQGGSRLEALADAMTREDPEVIGDFMHRQLSGLAAADLTTRRIRESVLVWLHEGCSATRAAARLHTHKNTVLYRLQRAEDILGHALTEDRLGLELALTLAERIGSPGAPPLRSAGPGSTGLPRGETRL
jgi:hypothetical protein